MRHKIPCFCDNTFTVDVPEEINLDTDPQLIEDILAGNFMNYTCSSCGKKHKPEFPLTVNWPGKGIVIETLPELDRGEFYRRKEDKNQVQARETIISYPELAERIAMYRDDLVPEAVESIKYYLLMKADETYPEADISVWYNAQTKTGLEFHIHGIKNNEVAVTRIPLPLYEKTLDDYKKNPKAEPFGSLRVKSYCSVQNMLRPDVLK
ncbi:hypothetical protein AGMMS50230_21500 [Spirochaetia bacterium]|nr:hypothetical protein AGMMS50230_21500 [Spirochaetia bacterium]